MTTDRLSCQSCFFTLKSYAMTKFCLTLLSLITIATAYGQKIYSVDSKSRADLTVYVVDAEYKADLIVYKTDKDYRAKANENKGIWYFTDKSYRADKKVYFTDRPTQADLKVYFTDKDYRAGWKSSEKKPLLY